MFDLNLRFAAALTRGRAVMRGLFLVTSVLGLAAANLARANTPPVANAGGPYQLTVGGTVVLNAARSADLDAGDAPVTFSWDVDGDGVFGDLMGPTPTLVWSAFPLAAGTTTLSVRVTDRQGASTVATAQLTVLPSALASPAAHLVTYAVFGGRPDNVRTALAPPMVAADGKIYGTTEYTQYSPSVEDTIYRVNPDGTGFVVLHAFNIASEGKGFYGPLVQADDGKLYGTAASGGQTTFGTIFSITPDGTFQVVYNGTLAAGCNPFGGMVKGADGRLYGLLGSGGSASSGCVCALDPATGQLTHLHDFNGTTDGGFPAGGVAFGADGKLYGTTSDGGSAGLGTIYRVNTDGTGFTVLRTMTDSNDGTGATGPLVQGSDGLFYGTFRTGGANYDGVIFSVSTSGTYNIVHSFGAAGDGLTPSGRLVRAGDGRLYGTTESGGTANKGTIFSLMPGGAYTLVRSLAAATDGTDPVAGLAPGPSGNLIGATSSDAVYGSGALFSVTTDGTFAVIHSFSGRADGAVPAEGLIQGNDGQLYGTTIQGGLYGAGTIYRMNPDGGGQIVLHAFDGVNDGANPQTRLLLANDGRLYGATRSAGPNQNGTLFRLNTDGSSFTVLRSLVSSTDGGAPSGPLMQASNGMIYGTTSLLYSPGGGVFSLNADGTGFALLQSLTGSLPGSLVTGLTEAPNHRLYGATDAVLYSLKLDGTNFVTEHTFAESVEGKSPRGGLTLGDGLFYGVTAEGGTKGYGTVFTFNPTNGAVAVLHGLDRPTEGYNTSAGLAKGADGKFYGATYAGGPQDTGVLFSVTPAGVFTVLRVFDGTTEGINPLGTLVQASNGRLYGTTSSGGPYTGTGVGTIYSYGLNQAPTAVFSATPAAAMAGTTVQFGAVVPADPDGDSVTYAWDFGDGATSTGAAPAHAYAVAGNFTATLHVTDSFGAAASASKAIAVAASAPTGQIYFGTVGTGGQFALYLRSNREAVLILYLPNAGGSFVTTVAVAADGSFNTVLLLGTANVTTALGQDAGAPPRAAATIALAGQITGAIVTGAISPTGETLAGAAQPAGGPSANVAGLYEASVFNSANGQVWFIVGTNGVMMVGSTHDGVTQASSGVVAADGLLALTLAGNVALQGNFNPTTHAVSGQFLNNGVAGAGFGGVADTVTRTDRLVNISTRGLVGDGEKAMFAGFVITGAQPKTVLVRASGPTLGGYGVGGVMDNPVLKIFQGTTEVAGNDDWSASADAALLASTADRVGGFALTAGSKDAALITTLAPGVYSAQVTRATGSSTGLALVEVYDANANPGADPQKVVNISTRGEVRSGESIMIAGFVITGNAPKKVLIRGVGPTLGQYGVGGFLTNPRLDLYQGQKVIAANDDWGVGDDATLLSAAATQVGGFALTAGSKDAALLITLAPGAYSAQVSGADGGTGIALLEVYEVE